MRWPTLPPPGINSYVRGGHAAQRRCGFTANRHATEQPGAGTTDEPAPTSRCPRAPPRTTASLSLTSRKLTIGLATLGWRGVGKACRRLRGHPGRTHEQPPMYRPTTLRGPSRPAPTARGAAQTLKLGGAVRDPILVRDQLPHRRAARSRPADLPGRLQFMQQLQSAGIADASPLGDRVRAQPPGVSARSRSRLSA